MGKYILILVYICLIQGAAAITYYYMDDYCGSTITLSYSHQIRFRTTRSYNYPSNFQCRVTLKTTDFDERLMVYFKDLDMESTCANDWVELRDGDSRLDDYIGGGKKCGYSTPRGVYTTTGRYLTVYFHSDPSIEGKGFDLIITSFHTGYCYSWEYTCNNGRCINDDIQCSGYNPCGDYSDCSALSAGGITGIVIGSIIFTTVVVIIVVGCRRRRAVIVHRTPVMSSVATVQTASSSGYGYSPPVPQNYPPPPYPSASAPQYPQYSMTTGVATVQY